MRERGKMDLPQLTVSCTKLFVHVFVVVWWGEREKMVLLVVLIRKVVRVKEERRDT